MGKEQAIVEFLKGLRIVLNNASAYNKEHPYFAKSVENFRIISDSLFPFLNPIKIGVTPKSLFIEEKYLDNAMLYEDIAYLFHRRKIKAIQIRQGASLEELVNFMSAVSQPVRNILRQGGLPNILKQDKDSRVLIEELDYSELLHGEGEETKDIWVYLLKSTVKNEDDKRIKEFADNFKGIIEKFKPGDLFDDEEFNQNLLGFLDYLKEKGVDKLSGCNKELLKFVLRDRDDRSTDKIDKVRMFFKDLNKEDLTEALFEGISEDDNFDYLSLTTFSRLFNEDTHREVANILEGKVKNSEFLKNNPKARKKVRQLFLGQGDSEILPFYRYALAYISESAGQGGDFHFDRVLARKNYRFLLLNLFVSEKSEQALDLITDNLLRESSSIIEENDLQLMRLVWEATDKKIKEGASLSPSLEKLQEFISRFLENSIFEEEDPSGFDSFIDRSQKSFLGFDYYLEKIFNKGKVNGCALKLLFKFFSKELPKFNEILEKRYFDFELMGKIVCGLGKIDSLDSVELLKKIFNLSNNLIRVEVLRSMQLLSNRDVEFLLSIMHSREPALKKESLLALVRDGEQKKAVLDTLLLIPSPFGKNNAVILENLGVVRDAGIKDAAGYLTVLSKRRFFWNRQIRNKALEILKEWDARKD